MNCLRNESRMTSTLYWLEILREASLTVNGFGIALIVHQDRLHLHPLISLTFWALYESYSMHPWTSDEGLTITLIPEKDIFCSKPGLTRLLDARNLNLASGRIQRLVRCSRNAGRNVQHRYMFLQGLSTTKISTSWCRFQTVTRW